MKHSFWRNVPLGIVLFLISLHGWAAESSGAIKTKWSPIQFGIIPPAQFCHEAVAIYGLRVSLIYAENHESCGLDTGVFNASDNTTGIQASLWNMVRDSQIGIGMGVANTAGKNMYGLQLGIFNQTGLKVDEEILNTHGSGNGAQIGWLNLSQAAFKGLQLGIINLSDSLFHGIQIGLINSDKDPEYFAEFLSGNKKPYDGRDSGLQIGVLNFNENGFLPIFPLINF